MNPIKRLTLAFLYLALMSGLAAAATTKGPGKALLDAAPAQASKGNTTLSSWNIQLLGGDTINQVTGSIHYVEAQFDPSFEKRLDMTITFSGPYVDAKNETVGSFYCFARIDGVVSGFRPVVGIRYAGSVVDSMTVQRVFSAVQECRVTANDPAKTLPKCTSAATRVGGAAKSLVDEDVMSGICRTSDRRIRRTTMDGSCQVDAANSSVIASVKCGQTWKLRATSLSWSRSFTEFK